MRRLTFATEEFDRICVLPDLELPIDLDLEGGADLGASTVGSFAKGNRLSPGLADRDKRGHAISS